MRAAWPTEIDGQNIITAFAVDGAALRELNTLRSGGGGPTVGVVDKAGHSLLITNFVTSSIVCFRLPASWSTRASEMPAVRRNSWPHRLRSRGIRRPFNM